MGVRNIASTLGELNAVASANNIIEFESIAYAIDGNNVMPINATEFGVSSTATNAPMLKIIDGGAGVTGGEIASVSNIQFTKEAGATAIEGASEGAVVSVPWMQVLGGMLAGIGVGIESYEANPDMWIAISNGIFTRLGAEPVSPTDIANRHIKGVFLNNKTYFSQELLQSAINTMLALNLIPHNAGYPTWLSVQQPVLVYETPNIASMFGMCVTTAKMSANGIGWVNAGREILLENVLNLINTSLANHGISLNGKLVRVYVAFGSYISFQLNVFNPATTADILELNDPLSTPDLIGRLTQKVKLWVTQIAQIQITHSIGTVSIRSENYSVTNRIPIDFYIGQLWNNSYNGASYANNLNTEYEWVDGDPDVTLYPNGVYPELPDSFPREYPDWYSRRYDMPWLPKRYIPTPTTPAVPFPIGDPNVMYPFIPITIPIADPRVTPIEVPQPDAQTGTPQVPSDTPNPNDYPVDWGNEAVNPSDGVGTVINPPPQPQPPIGNLPPVTLPTIGGMCNALFTVYNPSQQNIDSLGGVLWSQSIVQQIVQMFQNNPMDAIISLQSLYATPTQSANKNIKLGYIDSGVSSPTVDERYITINCGSVTVKEYFGDARDYSPYTEVHVYLPFIGIRQLKTEDIVGSVVGITYYVDVYTGVCLATINVTKDDIDQVLYTFEGNCAVDIPLTGADKTRRLGTLGSILIGGATGGLAGAGLAAAHGLASGGMKATISRSGNFSGSAGAMGFKKPYIILNRSIAYDANFYNTQYGYPANRTVLLGDLTGFNKIRSVHVDNVYRATDEEKKEILTLLEQGVIV